VIEQVYVQVKEFRDHPKKEGMITKRRMV